MEGLLTTQTGVPDHLAFDGEFFDSEFISRQLKAKYDTKLESLLGEARTEMAKLKDDTRSLRQPRRTARLP